MNKQYYGNIQLAAGLTNENYAEVVGFFVSFDVFFWNNEKKASYGLGNRVQVNDPP